MAAVLDKVTMKGNPVKLEGKEVKIGAVAPDATLTANDLSAVKISSFKGKKVILSVVPSLDTGICDIQTKKFNEHAGKLGNDVVILTISMDLPFAQKRWCGLVGSISPNLKTLSDHREAAFGKAYGVLIEGLRLLARSIFIIDAEGKLRYKQIVPEITTEPNYQEALQALNKL